MKDAIDRELARRFADLARSDEQSAPGFESVLGRDRVRVRSRVPVLARTAAVAAALSIVAFASVLWIQQSRRHELAAVSVTAWRSPTAALLETPGLDLLQSTPELGAPKDSATSPVPAAPTASPSPPKGAAS
jgi:hypothetical protein